MPPDQLAVDGRQHVRDVKLPGGAGDVGVKGHLHQDVTQFVGQLRRLAVVDGFQRLVTFLQQVAFQRFVGLLGVPRAAARPTQPRHDVNQRLKLADALFGNG